MAQLIQKPTKVTAVGNKPKIILEHVGRVNTLTQDVSVAHMKSPAGWVEPGQTPEFDEYTVVLKGTLKVSTKTKVLTVKAGQSVVVEAGEWVQYSTPQGAEYMAVCVPAFSPQTVHRDTPPPPSSASKKGKKR